MKYRTKCLLLCLFVCLFVCLSTRITQKPLVKKVKVKGRTLVIAPQVDPATTEALRYMTALQDVVYFGFVDEIWRVSADHGSTVF